MATRSFRGDAVAFYQKGTTTVGGTWADTDTVTCTINQKDLVVTLGATAASTVSNVAAAIVAAFNGDAITQDETRNFTGDTEDEFANITASANAGVITFLADNLGIPHEITFSETSSLGTIGASLTPVDTPQGDEACVAQNFSGDTLPTAGDTIVFEETSTSMKYALDALSGVGTITETKVKDSFLGDIALEESEIEGYLAREFALDCTTMSIGEGRGGGGGTLRLDNQTIQTAVNIDSGHTIYWRGTHVSNTMTVAGSPTVTVAGEAGQTAAIATLTVTGGGTVFLSDGVTLTTVTVEGAATVEVNSAATTITLNGSSTMIIRGSGAITTLNVFGSATCDHRGTGTITQLNKGPNANFTTENSSVADGALTITNATVDPGPGILNDAENKVTWTNAIDFGRGLFPTDYPGLQLGTNVNLKP